MAYPEVTLERVQQWAQKQELIVEVDDDGDLRAGFEELTIFVHCRETLLRVQGYWRGRFEPETDTARVREEANTFNSTSLMPKAMVAPSRGIVVFEHSASTTEGLSDAQLASLLQNSFASMFKAVETFEEKLPDLVGKKDN